MKIGLDFGTAYTKIAYLEANGELDLFHHPGRQGERIIPTAIAYCQNRPPVIQVGKSAILAAKSVRTARLVEYFKPYLLPENAPGRAGEPAPRAVIRDYLERLLISAVDSFESTVEKIDGVVLAVPQAWAEAPGSPAAAQLLSILRDDLQLPVLFAESEPVCAAAAYAYNFTHGSPNRSLPTFNVLVCDAGGSGFSATLCRVNGPEISVLACESTGQDMAQGGVAFDRACLQLLYQETHGQKPPRNTTDYLELFNNFEQARLEHQASVHGVIAELDATDPLFADTPLYTVDHRYEMQLRHAVQAYQPIGQTITALLQRLKSRLAAQGYGVDHLVIVGGFGQFPLVEATIRAFFADGPSPDLSINRENRPYAVATGAMLLANHIVQSKPLLNCTLGVWTLQKVNGLWQRGQLPILQAGRTRAGMLAPEFALAENARPELLEIRAGAPFPLPVYLQAQDAPPLALNLPTPAQYPPAGSYKIGAQVDPANQVTLVLESADGSRQYGYPLGSLPALQNDQGNKP